MFSSQCNIFNIIFLPLLTIFFNSNLISIKFLEVLPARYILAVLGCIGMGIIYGLKVNLSVAIVSMVNHTGVELMAIKDGVIHHTNSSHSEEECNFGDANETESKGAEVSNIE